MEPEDICSMPILGYLFFWAYCWPEVRERANEAELLASFAGRAFPYSPSFLSRDFKGLQTEGFMPLGGS